MVRHKHNKVNSTLSIDTQSWKDTSDDESTGSNSHLSEIDILFQNPFVLLLKLKVWSLILFRIKWKT